MRAADTHPGPHQLIIRFTIRPQADPDNFKASRKHCQPRRPPSFADVDVILTCARKLAVKASLIYYYYPRRARSALGVDTVLTLDVCLYVCMYVC